MFLVRSVIMAARSINSFGAIVQSLVTAPIFTLPEALASIKGVSYTEPTEILAQRQTQYGYVVECSDGRTRQINLNTVRKFRGDDAAHRAAKFFQTDRTGDTYRFVAAGGWSANQWFCAVVKA
jgi:hypothetical protein